MVGRPIFENDEEYDDDDDGYDDGDGYAFLRVIQI